MREPELTATEFVTVDNISLPVRRWEASATMPRAVIVALHGFNDYSNAFADPGQYLAQYHGITTYAYDQRGFGGAGERGTWAGTDTYVQDLRDFCRGIRGKHPGIPVYVMGESMGGAIAITAFTSAQKPDADGVILSAPAVWARPTMPWYQRLALFVGARVFPWLSLTGEGIDVTPSDNRDMLIALGRDPLVIKSTKVGAMYGLTNLMDEALASAKNFDSPALTMIGDLDEIVPNHASALMLNNLPPGARPQQKIVVYEKGYHMLLRDLQAKVVWEDIAAWIANPKGGLTSGADQNNIDQWLKDNLM